MERKVALYSVFIISLENFETQQLLEHAFKKIANKALAFGEFPKFIIVLCRAFHVPYFPFSDIRILIQIMST